MPAIRDEEYAAVAQRERPLIQATAYLLTGDPVQAERVVQLVFAKLYDRWPGEANPRMATIRDLLRTARTPVHLPWEYRERVELIDGPLPVAVTEPIVADLQTLSYDQRVVIVLECYAELSSAQIAEVLERPIAEVLGLGQQARATLAARHPVPASDGTLSQELRDAIPYDMREPHGTADDLAHGRRLTRRRWIQRGSATLVVGVLVIVAAVLLIPARPAAMQAPQAGSSVPIPTPSGGKCDPATSQTCRSKILVKWRSEMVEVVVSHLDPKGHYFSGFGYYYDSRYDMPSFWSGDGGALGLQVFRLKEGATEVYIQIATSRRFAIRCGATTRQQCLQFHFMDGNSYLLTDSTLNDGGIEVQYRPNDNEVITVIARNTQRGRVLQVSRGDLIKLVQDEQLRLPTR
jgi:DNA-directed RNA polymerase specialized sigma24 family protein